MFNPNESLTKAIVILFRCSFFHANIFMRRSIQSCGLPQSIFVLEGNIEMNLEETGYGDGRLILMTKLDSPTLLLVILYGVMPENLRELS